MAGKVKDYTGQVLNGREIVKLDYQNERGVAHWLWKCVQCGNTGVSRISSIKRAKNPSCCREWPSGEDNHNWSGYMTLTGKKIADMKENAKKRGLEWNVDKYYLWHLWDDGGRKCPYTGRELPDINKASLDRINSNRGYIPENVDWVHKDVNLAKQRLTRIEFISLCIEVKKNFTFVHMDGQDPDDPAAPYELRR